MLKLGGVVIPMKSEYTVEIKVKPRHIFDKDVMEFLNELSKSLLEKGRGYSDIATFAFWIRKASLNGMKKNYQEAITNRIGKGISFHIAPSNVPINFAFSLVLGLLSGNMNIVRIPSKHFEQVNIIIGCIEELLEGNYMDLKPYIKFVSYNHEKEINDYYSLMADTRVIWGGDRTIDIIRESKLKPRGQDITFADRFSVAVIDSEAFLKAENKERIVKNFYNDTYSVDQNACSSPKMIFWLNHNMQGKNGKDIFWKLLSKEVHDRYDLKEIQAVDKFSQLCRYKMMSNYKSINMDGNYIYRIELDTLEAVVAEAFYKSGYFFEMDILKLEDMLPILGEKCQTLVYYGLQGDELQQFIIDNKPEGVDRIMPMGHSMDFSLTWDGIDMIEAMSRKIQRI